MNVKVSNLHDLSTSGVRGLWFKHDLLSDYCPSYHPLNEMHYDNLSASIASEWTERRAITEKNLDRMRLEREQYEEKMEKLRLKEEADLKNKKKPEEKKSGKSKKQPKREETPEPPIVDETTYVDVEEEFVAYEDAEAEREQKKSSPDALQLTEHEVCNHLKTFLTIIP